MNLDLLSPLQRSAVSEIANIGLGHAAQSLAELTGQAFQISVPEVSSAPIEQIVERLGGYERLCVGIYMPFEGDSTGYLAFVMPWESAIPLWQMLLMESPNDPSEVNELHASVVIEIGNIINSHFLNAISDMSGLAMHSTPPSVGIESAYALLSSILVEAEMNEMVALSVETSLFNEQVGIDGHFLFIPSTNGLENVLEKLGLGAAA